VTDTLQTATMCETSKLTMAPMRSRFVFMAAMLSSIVAAQELTNCVLLGPIYPPLPNAASSQIIQQTQSQFLQSMNQIASTGQTPLVPIDVANTSFSVGVFSADSDNFLFEFHHEAPLLNGSLSGGVLDSNTLYRIGSITKLLTVYALLAKIRRDHWDEPVTNFIPELVTASSNNAVHDVKWHEVTLGALAGQLSGISRDCECRRGLDTLRQYVMANLLGRCAW
jgi:CubicO group peptidase (beta-lactamase class C family)